MTTNTEPNLATVAPGERAPYPNENTLILAAPPIESDNQADTNIYLSIGDPGSVYACWPLVRHLREMGSVTILAQGFASQQLKHIPPNMSEVTGDIKTLPSPRVIVHGTSEDTRPSEYLIDNNPTARSVIVSDYPGSEKPLMRALGDGVTLDKLVLCSPDVWAARKTAQEHLGLEVHATGSSAYDHLSKPDGDISQELRDELGIDGPLITYFSSMEGNGYVAKVAESLGKIASCGLAVAFRAHPRDLENYAPLFDELGVPLTDTSNYSTEQVRAASAVIIGRGSVLLEGIYSGIFTVYSLKPGEELESLPWHIQSCASIPATPEGLVGVVDNLLRGGMLATAARQAMETYYHRPDGQNTTRVISVIKRIFSQ